METIKSYELRTLQLGAETITYYLTKKKIKNLNMRIKSDGSIHVSAPQKTSQKYVDNFVQNNQQFIKNALEKLKDKPQKQKNIFADNHIIKDGKQLYLLGYQYTVNIIESAVNLVEVDQESMQLLVHTTYPQNEHKTQEIVDKWMKKQSIILFAGLCDRFYPQFAKYKISYPEIKTRKMKARWGSCNYSKKIITFADMLFYAPMPFIEYVVVHEMAHLAEPNHSKSFYNIVEQILPDWKERKQLVKSCNAE